MGTGNRSGQLDGTVWGVSRATSANNPTQGLLYDWAAVRRNTCGRLEVTEPEHDVAVCHGQAIEAVNDNGGVADLAMYPRQPFDFAGRTGTVEFDVSDNTQGPHAAWPSFLITDQPVPAPYEQAAGLADHAHDSVGFSLAAVCGQFGCGTHLPPDAARPGFSCVTRRHDVHHDRLPPAQRAVRQGRVRAALAARRLREPRRGPDQRPGHPGLRLGPGPPGRLSG